MLTMVEAKEGKRNLKAIMVTRACGLTNNKLVEGRSWQGTIFRLRNSGKLNGSRTSSDGYRTGTVLATGEPQDSG